MKLTTFNPVQQAVQSTRGFSQEAQRRFPLSLCWKCQKDKPKSTGKTSFLVPHKGTRLTVGNAPKKFICLDCLNEKQAKTLEAA